MLPKTLVTMLTNEYKTSMPRRPLYHGAIKDYFIRINDIQIAQGVVGAVLFRCGDALVPWDAHNELNSKLNIFLNQKLRLGLPQA
jgi:hypothetical protein